MNPHSAAMRAESRALLDEKVPICDLRIQIIREEMAESVAGFTERIHAVLLERDRIIREAADKRRTANRIEAEEKQANRRRSA